MPAGKTSVAKVTEAVPYREWTRRPEQQSAPLLLRAGRSYYIEVLCKAQRGPDTVSVAWKSPGGGWEVIPGKYLAPYAAEAIRLPSGMEAPAAYAFLPPKTAVRIANTSPEGYAWDILRRGQRVYDDNAIFVASFPPHLTGCLFLRTLSKDSASTGNAFVSFEVDRNVTVYVVHDARRWPSWLDGFTETGKWLHTTPELPLRAWAKHFPPGRVVLGGNLPAGSRSDPPAAMYTVVVLPGGVPQSDPASPDPSTVYRAVNLNGPAMTIGECVWESSEEAPNCLIFGRPVGDSAVPLDPPVEGALARMLRTGILNEGKAAIVLGRVPDGTYRLFLYVRAGVKPNPFSIAVQGRTVAQGVTLGGAGRWKRLGPWTAEATGGGVRLECAGGPVILCGIEIVHDR
jgi:hypothetical protein